MIAPTSFFADYGCHVRILEEIEALHARGHIVEVCTYHNGRDLPGVTVNRTVDIPWRKRVVVGSSKHKMYLDVALFAKVFREVRAFSPDIIHAHLHEGALIGSIIGRLFKIPVVFDYQGSLTEEMIDHGFLPQEGVRPRLVRQMEHLIDRLPAAILASSRAAAQHLMMRERSPGRVQVIDDAVNLKRFSPGRQSDAEAWRAKLGIPPGAPVVVYLGLLADYQGTPTLIRAASRLLESRRDAFVVIAGYPGVGRYSAMARELPHAERILFPGRIAYEEAPAFLSIGQAAAAPKRSLTEANGKILNYMAMGLPTVCVDSPVNRDLLGDLGLYFEENDPNAMARMLDDALHALPTQRDALRVRAAQKFSWDRQILNVEQVYDGLLETSARFPVERAAEIADAPATDD